MVSDAQVSFVLVFSSCIWFLAPIVGIATNSIVVYTFLRIGLTDGVTVSFLVLSIWYVANLVLTFAIGIANNLVLTERLSAFRFYVDPFAVFMYLANVLILMEVMKVLTTTYLAIIRCLCVVIPLSFKRICTRGKTVAFLCGFAVFALASNMAVLVVSKVDLHTDPVTNLSRVKMVVTHHREFIKEVERVTLDMTLCFASVVTVLVCVIVMIRSLQTASRFRCSLTPTVLKSPTKAAKGKAEGSHRSSCSRFTGKDIRVIQQVVLVSVIFIVCTTPNILINFADVYVPGFGNDGPHRNMYVTANSLKRDLDVLCSLFTLPIYYRYNSRFSATCKLPCHT